MLKLKSKKSQIALLCGAALLTTNAMSVSARPAPADMILRNANVVTVGARGNFRGAVGIRAGRIVYVGNEAGVRALAGSATKSIDLHGETLMPGLVDGHMHPLAGGAQLLTCNLNYAALSIAEFQTRIQACLDKDGDKEPNRLLEVVNWFQQNMEGGTAAAPTHELLDGLKTRRPIAVRSSFGHSTLINGRALQLSGIVAATKDPAGGRINRDAAGNPTGLLEDTAQSLIDALGRKLTPAENVTAAKAALAALRAQGITTFLDAAASEETISAFAAVQKQGGLTARAHFAVLIRPDQADAPAKAVAAVKTLSRTYDQGAIGPAPTITVRNAKLFMDGAITAPAFTGSMLEPYLVNRGTAEKPNWEPGPSRGPDPYFPLPKLADLLIQLADIGIDAHLHADGDGAVRIALDAIQILRQRRPSKDVRTAIAHDEVTSPADFGRFAQLGAIPVLSFQWAKRAVDTVDGAETFLGPDRFRMMEPEGYLQRAGARIAYGSDWPVDPLDEMYALKVAVTRTAGDDAPPQYRGRLGDDPGLSLSEAVKAITLNSSYELRQEHLTGSIETGKLADLIILDRDIFTVPANDIAKTKVQMTIVGGKIVYRRP